MTQTSWSARGGDEPEKPPIHPKSAGDLAEDCSQRRRHSGCGLRRSASLLSGKRPYPNGSSPAGAVIHADFGGDYRSNMVAIRDMLSEAKDMREQTRPEFEAYEKTVETALFNLQRSAGPETGQLRRSFLPCSRDRRSAQADARNEGAWLDEQDGRNAAGDVPREEGPRRIERHLRCKSRRMLTSSGRQLLPSMERLSLRLVTMRWQMWNTIAPASPISKPASSETKTGAV